MKSIKTKLIGILLLLAFILSLSNILVSSIISRGTLYSNQKNNLEQIAKATTQQIDSEIENIFESTFALANIYDIAEEDFSIILNEEIERNNYFTMAYVDTDGITHFVNYFEQFDISDTKEFKSAMYGNIVLSDPFISELNNKLMFACYTPILDDYNNTIGVLMTLIDVKQLSTYISDITVGKTGKAVIIDNDGTIIASLEDDLVLNQKNISEMTSDKDKVILNEMASMETGNGTVTYNGKKSLIAYAPLTNANWSLGILIESSEFDSVILRLVLTIIVSSVIIFILSFFIFYRSANSIAKTIKSATSNAIDMSNGNLAYQINEKLLKRKDELGHLFKGYLQIKDNLSDMIKNISVASTHMSETSTMINDSSQIMLAGMNEMTNVIGHIADNSSTQVENVEKAQKTMDILSSIIDEDLMIIKELLSSFQKMNDSVGSGQDSLVRLQTKSGESSKSMDKVYAIVKDTNDSALKISEATAMIAQVAEETNLLALNAAIEAARAGEYGKGFAVVADEIRKLSEQSAQSTDKIKQIVLDLQDKSNSAFEETKSVNDAFKEQINILQATQDRFKDISDAINMSQAYVSAIEENSKMMMDKKKDVEGEINGVLALSESIAASTQQAAASSQEQTSQTTEISNQVDILAQLASELKMSVDQFTTE